MLVERVGTTTLLDGSHVQHAVIGQKNGARAQQFVENLHIRDADMCFAQEDVLILIAAESPLKLLPNHRARSRILIHDYTPQHPTDPRLRIFVVRRASPAYPRAAVRLEYTFVPVLGLQAVLERMYHLSRMQ